ncbi:PRC and DUF2382 domain-containing protein [Nonomuraea rosea]|uniref:PRC and DUF2382 domain-containing protein n=2 Tax=Nonomuraea rosea TaxID=638574 RepID=A0ABP6YSD6_9ACTN
MWIYGDLGYLSCLNQDERIGGIVVAMQTEIRNLLDCHVVGSDGQSIGKVGQVYLNDRSGEPEWVTVRTGFFGMKQTFVPLANARRSGEEIRVPFDKEMIKDAPNIDVDGRLSLEEEADLYRYYGMQPSNIPRQRAGEPTSKRPVTGDARRDMGTHEDRTGMTGETRKTGMPGMAGRTDRTDERDFDITRSEEQLHIGKESREIGHVRLRKYVETENVKEKIPLTHEEIVIERELIHDGDAMGAQIGEEEREVTLYEERAVVGKETKPVERIHVHKESVQHEETVEGQVRKERLEIDEDGMERDQNGKLHRRDRKMPPER